MTSGSCEATHNVAKALAGWLSPGDLVLLEGELGAGKTTFCQGLAEALGVEEPVTSPTFTLVRSYATQVGFELLHVDLYRLESRHEVLDLGLGEALDEGAVALVEWGDRAQESLGPPSLWVRLRYGSDPGARELEIEADPQRLGPRRLAQLSSAILGSGADVASMCEKGA